MVGCVIVVDNKIIAEGYTSPYGGNHAEVNAINAVKENSVLKTATLYVTLEPCSHHGKTPPCSDLIIKHKIPNVVVGCIDDNPEVAGKGIQNLKDSGCIVTVGVLEKECKEHHKRFFTFHNNKRPYIILKWAETNDGFIAPNSKDEKKPVWITNEFSRLLVHKWRTEEQSILVGKNTVKEDNPSLTARDYKGKNPVRIVIDKDKKLSEDYRIFNKLAKTIIISKDNTDFSKPIAQQIGYHLYNHNINSLIIEGGSITLQTFINENLWDEARVFIGPNNFHEGVKAPIFNMNPKKEIKILNDLLKLYRND